MFLSANYLKAIQDELKHISRDRSWGDFLDDVGDSFNPVEHFYKDMGFNRKYINDYLMQYYLLPNGVSYW